ncbi:MAG: leucyl aminopeptidase family protein, partial [Actinomycetota bacterium]
LTNAPASEATPAMIADEAAAVAKRLGLTSKVWTRDALGRGGFGGILGVGAGSANEPRLVELAYRGAGRDRPIAITGKGVTFDSGGLNVKRASEMAWMRSDVAGGAAALATLRAVAELGLTANVIAAVPFAENMPGGRAIRPGDVVHHRGGRTSEVLDTDAEGRVMVADALAYLSEQRPAVLLDSATLTDASGLGPDLWAVMGTDRALVAEVLIAGSEAGEPGWEIPLWSRYRPMIDSTVADVKNVGDHGADSAMLAGLFLRDFVGDVVPWAHLDTGSSAWAEHATDLWPEGATGAPTRAFLRFVERRAAASGG